tara:strand:- start:381 stop:1811 length:1431 start_codon:yes stop_codon:yes gene_type:complete
VEEPTRFEPISPPQWAFLASDRYEVLYGGAAFGGKSLCLVIDALRQVDHPRYLAMLFRRQYSELSELIEYAMQFYPAMGGVPRESGRDWTFPSGSKILFRQMEHAEDWRKYMGRNTTYLGFDELVSFTEDQYLGLQIWNRAAAKGLKCYLRSTTNPWPDVRGDSLDWIIDRWDIPKYRPVNEAIYTSDFIETPKGEIELTKAFIPATYRDNEIGQDNNPHYIANLMRQPDEYKRKAFLDGIWGVSPGTFFSTFDHQVHILDADEMERRMNEEKVRQAAGMDYGSTSATCVIFGSQTLDGTIYIYDEYYMPDKPIAFHAPQILKRIGKDRINIICDPSMEKRSSAYVEYTDKTIIDEFKKYGLRLTGGYNKQLDGYTAIKELLFFDTSLDKPLPGVYISRKCKHLIHDMEMAQQDKDNPDLVEKDGQYHALAAFRYLVMHIKKPTPVTARRDITNTPAGVLQRLKRKSKKTVQLYAR